MLWACSRSLLVYSTVVWLQKQPNWDSPSRKFPFADYTFLYSDVSMKKISFKEIQKIFFVWVRNILSKEFAALCLRCFPFKCGMDKLSCVQEQANINRIEALKQSLHWCCYIRSHGSKRNMIKCPRAIRPNARYFTTYNYPVLEHPQFQNFSVS